MTTLGLSDISDKLLLLSGQRREDAILSLASDPANSPSWMYSLIPVEWTQTIDGKPRKIKIFVTPDWFSLGFDTKGFVRVPMWPSTAQTLADQMGMALPSRFLSKKIQDNAFLTKPMQIVPAALPRPSPRMETTEAWLQSQDMTQKALGDYPPGALLAGFKKDVVVGPNLDGSRVAIFGGMWPNGSRIQDYSTIHNAQYSDYSHGIRMISRQCFVDDVPTDLYSVFADPVLSSLVSDQGPFLPRFPNAEPSGAAIATSGILHSNRVDVLTGLSLENFVRRVGDGNIEQRKRAADHCRALCARISRNYRNRPWFRLAQAHRNPIAAGWPIVLVIVRPEIPRDELIELYKMGRGCPMRIQQGAPSPKGRTGTGPGGRPMSTSNPRPSSNDSPQVGHGGGHGGYSSASSSASFVSHHPHHVAMRAVEKLHKHVKGHHGVRSVGVARAPDGGPAVALFVNDNYDDLRDEIRDMVAAAAVGLPVIVQTVDDEQPAGDQGGDDQPSTEGTQTGFRAPSLDGRVMALGTQTGFKAPQREGQRVIAMGTATGFHAPSLDGRVMALGVETAGAPVMVLGMPMSPLDIQRAYVSAGTGASRLEDLDHAQDALEHASPDLDDPEAHDKAELAKLMSPEGQPEVMGKKQAQAGAVAAKTAGVISLEDFADHVPITQ